MAKQHIYETNLVWVGNKGSGTMDYRSYDRDFTVEIEGKAQISGSSDSIFLGDKSKYNPEDLLLSSVSSCHMLWYLHLCSKNGIVVLEYKEKLSERIKELLSKDANIDEERIAYEVVFFADKSNIDEEIVRLKSHIDQFINILN